MIFNVNESADVAEEDVTVDGLDQIDDIDSAEGVEKAAEEIERHTLESALEAFSYFDGGDEALREFCVSEEAQILVEAKKMPKRTFVRLAKNDDLKRREHMAAIIIAREKKDSLFTKYALARLKCKQLRKQIFQKYGSKSKVIAKRSQQIHIRNSKNSPADALMAKFGYKK